MQQGDRSAERDREGPGADRCDEASRSGACWFRRTHACAVAAGPVNGSDTCGAALRALTAAEARVLARLDYGMLMTSASSWLGTNRLARPSFIVVTDLQGTATPLQFADLEPPAGVTAGARRRRRSARCDQSVRHRHRPVGVRTRNVFEVRVGGAPRAGRSLRTVVLISIDGKGERPQDADALDAGFAAGRHAVAAKRCGVSPARPRCPALGAPARSGLQHSRRSSTSARAHRATVTLEPRTACPRTTSSSPVIEHREPRALIIGANARRRRRLVLRCSRRLAHQSTPRRRAHRLGCDQPARARGLRRARSVRRWRALGAQRRTTIQRYLEGGGTVLMTLGPRAARLDRIPLSGHTAHRSQPQQPGRRMDGACVGRGAESSRRFAKRRAGAASASSATWPSSRRPATRR